MKAFVFAINLLATIYAVCAQAIQVKNNQQGLILSKNFPISSKPTTRYYQFDVTQMQGAPDGYRRTMLVVNGQFPGPLIELNSGDRLVVKVNNHLDQGTAIHWHGLWQNGTNWMDGTTGVTQCAIPSGGSFTYNFTVPYQRGTFWWHSHVAGQYADGIHGPLIIHDPTEGLAQEYDEDVIVMITDWYHNTSQINTAWYLSPQAGSNEPVPENGLINGLNVFNCSRALDTTASCKGGYRAKFQFKHGSRYRLRLINTGAFADFDFSIDNHTLTVVEADGIPVQAVNVTRLPIAVAQRYSVIVHADQPVANYWMRAVMNQNCFTYVNDALDRDVRAVIQYANAPNAEPTTLDTNLVDPETCNDLDQSELCPRVVLNAPDYDINYYIEVKLSDAGQAAMAYMNDTSWRTLTTTTTLLEANANKAVSSFGDNQFVVTPPTSANVIQVTLRNLDGGTHPFHLHGHTFWVLGYGDGDFNPSNNTLKTANPLRRDTVTIPADGWLVIRFIATPGMWMFHCHIIWHMEAGLAMQFRLLPEVIASYKIPADVKALCSG